eukprot:3351992-Prymnesium_polylepis.1
MAAMVAANSTPDVSFRRQRCGSARARRYPWEELGRPLFCRLGKLGHVTSPSEGMACGRWPMLSPKA